MWWTKLVENIVDESKNMMTFSRIVNDDSKNDLEMIVDNVERVDVSNNKNKIYK